MRHWIGTTNGTVSGPFTHAQATAEYTRLMRKSGGRGAEEIRIVEADTPDEVREYMNQPWI